VRGDAVNVENDNAVHGQLVDDGDAAIWQWSSPDAPDVYRVLSQNDTVFAAALAIPVEEADLATLPADVVRDRLAAGREIHFVGREDAASQSHDLWKWFAVGVVFCLLAEIGTLIGFRI
jgi:hypothetical protein